MKDQFTEFKENTLVRIAASSIYYRMNGPSNPKTVGSITYADCSHGWDCRVIWNEEEAIGNCYMFEDLEVVSSLFITKKSSNRVIVFNAPPRAGKDAGTDYMTDLINESDGFLAAFHLSFKSKLVEMTARIFGLTVEEFLKDYDEPSKQTCGWHKDDVQYHLTLGTKKFSQRTALQFVSEKVAKPMFGESVFGDALALDIKARDGVIFVSDSGFAPELQPVVDEVGAENVLVLQLFREGCTYEGDTRDYLDSADFPNVKFVEVENNSSLNDFLTTVALHVGIFLNK